MPAARVLDEIECLHLYRLRKVNDDIKIAIEANSIFRNRAKHVETSAFFHGKLPSLSHYSFGRGLAPFTLRALRISDALRSILARGLFFQGLHVARLAFGRPF